MILRICLICSKTFAVYPNLLNRGRGKYCSHRCRDESMRVSIETRFWSSVRKTETCWLWVGLLNHSGYGSIGVRSGHMQLTHRLSWIIHNGPIPDGLGVLHNCNPNPDNPACCNPAHLWLGTQTDNNRDAMLKGQRSKGVGHPFAKLTEESVREIRALHGSATTRDIAARLGVSHTAIINVIHRRTWRHVS